MSRRTLVLGGLGSFALLMIALLVVVRLVYGGGTAFPDVSTPPLVNEVDAVELTMPPGCVAVSREGRVFFDTHPFAAPGRFGEPHVFELVDGQPRPWPSAAAQSEFVAPFGMVVDDQERLWITEPATLDRPATRLIAFDVASGRKVFDHRLPDGEARFAQDLRVSPDGKTIVLADTGAFDFTPGQLIVFDVASKTIVRRFRHPTLNPQPWFIRRWDGGPHKVLGGLVTFRVGVDGITFSPDGAWLTYGTMSHDTLYRLPSALLLDPGTSDEALADAIEVVGPKPQSDGIAATPSGHVLLADVENGGLAVVAPDGELQTVTASDDVVWADGVAVATAGPHAGVWFTDSAIPAYLRQDLQPPSRAALDAAGPYRLYRFDLPVAFGGN